MRVKVGNQWFECERDQPIMVELLPGDKENIANMHPDATKYALFDDHNGWSTEQKYEWMMGISAPPSANPAQGVIRQIVEDALNSAIPEPWEVAEYATQRILAAIGASGEPFKLVEESDEVGTQMVVASAIGTVGQAVAVRHSYDGDGWLYSDKGNGSDWLDRAMIYPDAELLYTHPVQPGWWDALRDKIVGEVSDLLADQRSSKYVIASDLDKAEALADRILPAAPQLKGK